MSTQLVSEVNNQKKSCCLLKYFYAMRLYAKNIVKSKIIYDKNENS